MTAVLFDFSGTLCRIESTEPWLRTTLAATGTRMDEHQLVAAAAALEIAGTAWTSHPDAAQVLATEAGPPPVRRHLCGVGG